MTEEWMAEGAGKEGMIVIISGPSGSGKTTLAHALINDGAYPMTFSVSVTSRSPRKGEVHGKDYWFVSPEEFQRMRDAGELLEFAEVHGNCYGTPRKAIEDELASGRWVVLDIDPEGRRQVKKLRPDAVSFFVRAPSDEQYENRLRTRGTEADDELDRRLRDIREQLRDAPTYDFQIVNETLEQAIRTFKAILRGITHDDRIRCNDAKGETTQ